MCSRLPVLIVMFCLLFIFGCTKMDIVNEPVPEILQARKVCIIEDVDTREFYRTAMKKWFRRNGIKPEIMHYDSPDDVCEWTMRYYGKWAWCVGVYLAETEMVVYQHGLEAGRVGLEAGKFDGNKWENGEQRIFKLLDMLSGKSEHYDPVQHPDK